MAIEKIRVSVGSASVLGLNSNVFENPPTTCYIMTYTKNHCNANCAFCPQSRESKSSAEKLSRINWPNFLFNDFLIKLELTIPLNKFKRICIQTLNYPENFKDLIDIITQIKKITNIPISVAIPPLSKEKLEVLKIIGVQRIGIALDGSTPEIFDKIKGKEINGPYKWEKHFQSLTDSIEIFTKGFVSTHLIVGLGESHREILNQIKDLNQLGIIPALFAFTPIKGTKFENKEPPFIIDFRKIQLGRYLIIHENKEVNDFKFNFNSDIINFNITKENLTNIIDESKAFMTSGCEGCNRPYYNSRPSGPFYNFPRKLNENEKDEIYDLLKKFVI